MKKRILSLFFAICILSSLAACATQDEVLSTGTLGIEHEEQFGGVYLHVTIDDFLSLGFDYGDSVDIRFSNGYVMEAIPFYSGYYTGAGEALLCAYPGYPYVDACINFGGDLFTTAALNTSDTAVVTLHKKAAFLPIEEALHMKYSNERTDFASDEAFANFRVIRLAHLPEKLIYRSASPCDDQYNRASYVSALAEQAGIVYILDLADDEKELRAYYEDESLSCPYWKQLYEAGNILALDMSANYHDQNYAASVAALTKALCEQQGPFLIHCTEGKDRTGFVCLLVEILAGASYEELRDDYMKTYDNYYGITRESNAASYDAVVRVKFNDMLQYLCETDDPTQLTPEQLTAGAEKYLSFGGATDTEIQTLKNALSEN